jgi:hypothetical protein
VGTHKTEHLEAVHVGHVQVEHHQLDRAHRKTFDGLETGAGLDELHPLRHVGERGLHHPADGR